MLNLILGLSGTGKTQLVLSQIKQRAQNAQKSILLVPEQFSSAAEIRAYNILGDENSAFVTVCSFTNYAEKILKAYGGVAINSLTDAGRVVYLRRAMDSVADNLLRYKNHRRSPKFCAMCADVITELKTAGATPQDLANAAKGDVKNDKLAELALIYGAYNSIIENTAMDPADRISFAAQKPFEQELLQTAVFVDNFDGFTAPEYKMFEKLLQAQSCTVSLCCESLQDNEGGIGLTSSVKKTAAHLRAIAAKKDISVAVPICLETDYRHANAPTLLQIAKQLSVGAVDDASTCDGFFVTQYDGNFAQAKAVACKIVQLALNGTAYSEIAIICRDLSKYQAQLKIELEKAAVPYFMDSELEVEYTAPAAFLRAALNLAKTGINSESILRLLKTGICGVDEYALSCLENYAYTWKLGAALWRCEFVQNPSGFGDKLKQDDEILAGVEAVRKSIMPKLERFLASVKNADAKAISRALYILLDSFDASKNVIIAAQVLQKEKGEEAALSLYRSWDITMEFLSQMAQLLADEAVSPTEYDELLLILMRNSSVGRVPQAQNAVIVTTADRMRLESPLYCFVIGAVEGEFPFAVGASGLLTHQDREALIANNIEMPGGFENRMLLEQMFFYKALTACKKGLFVSYVSASFGGGEPCAPLAALVRIFKPQAVQLSQLELAPTPQAALELLSDIGLDKSELAQSLESALLAFDAEQNGISAMKRVQSMKDFVVEQTDALKQILGESLTLSPTRIERYQSCKFSYYLEYVLGIKLRKKAELSPLESGSLVHYVLENVLRNSGEDFTKLTRQELVKLTSDLADEYITQKMPDDSTRFAQLITRIKRNLVNLLEFMQTEQEQSSFKPVAFEEEIGFNGIPPLTFKTQNGETVRVVGKIDRVDVMQRQGKNYIRVIDYKTGNKKFKLDDVYCGLNTQMLIYLFTLCQNGGDKYQNPVSSGVMYLLSDNAPKVGDRNETPPPMYEIDGILLNDEVVLRAMDKDLSGVFIPIRFKNDGSPYKTNKLASLEKLGKIKNHIDELVCKMAHGLYCGDIAAKPLVLGAKRLCDVCDYRAVCTHEDGINENVGIVPDDVFEEVAQL